MFEELSRSGELRDEYEQAKQEKNKAEQDTHANFQKKKGVEKQKKEVRLEKEVAQKYAALKTQYVRIDKPRIFIFFLKNILLG
jgi:structural maintenance of chromosome 1